MQRYNNDRKLNTGRPWVNLVSRMLAHVTIVLACVICVVLACDVFLKGEMSFLANPYARALIFALAVIAFVNSLIQLSCLYKLRSFRRYRELKARKK